MPLTPDLLKPGASDLPALCAAIGIALALLALPALFAPGWTARRWKAFPRCVWPGRILAVIALAWSAIWLLAMPLGPLDILKRYMTLLFLVAVPATWFLCDDLLACRAVGGLLALIPSALLPSAQWHPSPLRYIPLVVGYLFVVASLFLIAQPFHLRDVLFWGAASTSRTRFLGAIVAAVAAAMLATALLA